MFDIRALYVINLTIGVMTTILFLTLFKKLPVIWSENEITFNSENTGFLTYIF